jgi:hypoxanthine phosphoribosyltransferase
MNQCCQNKAGLVLKQCYSEERIALEVTRLAREISIAYKGQELLLIVVLKGALFFAADLMRQIELPLVMDFVRLSSYSGFCSTGTIVITKQPEIPVKDRQVLIVEDIIDTGLTLDFLLSWLKDKGAGEVRTCTLIDKKAQRKVKVAADFIGIDSDRGFLVGYGLDFDEHLREMRGIYEVIAKSPDGGVNDTPV